MQLNDFQKAACRTYGRGLFSYIGKLTDPAEIQQAINETDDLAFQDIMMALGRDDCTTRERAVELMQEALAGVEYIQTYRAAPEPSAVPGM